MPVTPGTRLGSYEVTALLGTGGMSEVYRARDGKLNRDVAIKILSDTFARRPEWLARLEREAQLLGSPRSKRCGWSEGRPAFHCLSIEINEIKEEEGAS